MTPSCEHIRERLADLHDGSCTRAEAEALRHHLEGCEECRRHKAEFDQILDTLDASPEETPSPMLRENFQRMLKAECEAEKEADLSSGRLRIHRASAATKAEDRGLLRFPFAAWTQLTAAACLLLMGGIAGATLFRPAKEATQSTAATQSTDTQRQLAEVQARLDSMSQLVSYNFSHQQPDGVRLQRVAAHATNPTADSARLASLLGTLAFDPSTNVRLSALEALYPHGDQIIVRDGVIASLPRERSPLVQIAMVDFLSALGDPRARESLDALSHDPSAAEPVREAARRALAVSL